MLLILVLFSYLIGSIPSGYIFVKKILNKDIRNYGSGNIGATNVKRVAGKKLSNIVLLCDMLKAIIPVLLTKVLIANNIINVYENLSLGLVAIAAILGHNYTIFLKFKGGKGVATSAAAFIFIAPKAFIVTAIVFFSLKLITKIVSIRSLISALVLFITTWLFNYDIYIVSAAFLTCILCFWRHRSNIVRLINGVES